MSDGIVFGALIHYKFRWVENSSVLDVEYKSIGTETNNFINA